MVSVLNVCGAGWCVCVAAGARKGLGGLRVIADLRYTGQAGGDKMGGKIAVAESSNGVQFVRSEGPVSPSFFPLPPLP